MGTTDSLRDLRSTQTTVEEEHSCVSVCVAVSYRQKKKENVSIEYEKQQRTITKHLFDPFCGTGYSVGRVIGPLSRGVSVFLCFCALCFCALCSVLCALCSVLCASDGSTGVGIERDVLPGVGVGRLRETGGGLNKGR